MTDVQERRDRAAKWMRRIARILALIWAGGWTFLIAFFAYILVAVFSTSLASLAWYFAVVVIVWVPAAIAWRREAIGGVLLVAEGLLGFTLVAWVELQTMLRWGMPMPGHLPLFFGGWALPPLVAGILFLVSWRISKAPESSHDGAQGRK